MTRLEPPDPLAALVRVQLESLRSQVPTARPSSSNPAVQSAARADRTADIASRAASRIRSLQPFDPQINQKAVRIFLESVLLAELGESLVSDPEFDRMVDHVIEQFNIIPKLALAAEQAAAFLLRQAVQER